MNFVSQSIDKTRMFCAQCIFPLFLIINHTRLFLNVVISSSQDCLWWCTLVLCTFLMITLNPEILGWKFVFLFLSTTTEYGSLLNVKVSLVSRDKRHKKLYFLTYTSEFWSVRNYDVSLLPVVAEVWSIHYCTCSIIVIRQLVGLLGYSWFELVHVLKFLKHMHFLNNRTSWRIWSRHPWYRAGLSSRRPEYNRELKNHDEVHDDDVCWLRKDWNENVGFGGKRES